MDSTVKIWTTMTNDFSLRCVFVLFHFVWQGALLAIAAKVATAFLGNESASAKYWVSAIGLFACPLCIAITFLKTSPPYENPYRQSAEISEHLGSNSARATTDATRTLVPQSYLEPRFPNSKPESSVSVSQGDKMLLFVPEKLKFVLAEFSGGLFCVYTICVLVFLARLGTAIIGSGRLRIATWTLADPAKIAILVDRTRAMGVSNAPTVAYSHRIQVPIVVGLLRPMILLPASIATGIVPQDFAAIISHELAHVRRYDLWFNLLQRLIESFLFFHPGVWYLSRRMTFERELCCDDLVVATGLQPMRYAEALLQVATLCSIRHKEPSFALSVFGVRSSSLEMRVKRLINSPEIRRASSSRIVSIFLVLPVLIAAMWPFVEQIWNSSLLRPKQSVAIRGLPVQRMELQSNDDAN